jgi:hypothetical protein
MAKSRTGSWGTVVLESTPKKTRQGASKHTKHTATSRNSARKKYRGQGRG